MDLVIGKLVEVKPQELDIFSTFVGKIIDFYEEEDGQVPITTVTVQNVKDFTIKNVDSSQIFEFSCNS